jgi:hypothetical protein
MVSRELFGDVTARSKKGVLGTTAQLAMAVEQGLISPQMALKLGPKMAVTSTVNPLSAMSFFGSALGTSHAAQRAAEFGEAEKTRGVSDLTADLSAVHEFAENPKGYRALGRTAAD